MSWRARTARAFGKRAVRARVGRRTIRIVLTGLPAALAGTLIIAVLAWYALRQVRTGQWSSWRRSSINRGLVRVSGAFGLAFCAAALFAVWWSTLAQPR